MFGSILSATVSRFFRWFDLLIIGGAISLYAYLVGLLISSIFPPNGTSQTSTTVVLVVVAQIIIIQGGTAILTTALTRLVLLRLRGQSAPLSAIFDGIGEYAGPALRYVIIFSVVSILLVFGYLFLVFGGSGLSAAAQLVGNPTAVLQQAFATPQPGMACIMSIVFIVVMFLWAAMNALVYPVIADERIGGWTAIIRSYSLVQRNWGMFFGLMLISMVLAFIIGLISEPILNSALRTGNLTVLTVWSLVLATLSTVTSTLFTSIWYIAVTGPVPAGLEIREPRVSRW